MQNTNKTVGFKDIPTNIVGIWDYPLVTKTLNNQFTGTIKYFRNANLKLSIIQLVLGIRKNPIFKYL